MTRFRHKNNLEKIIFWVQISYLVVVTIINTWARLQNDCRHVLKDTRFEYWFDMVNKHWSSMSNVLLTPSSVIHPSVFLMLPSK